jgi:hypothetical protein
MDASDSGGEEAGRRASLSAAPPRHRLRWPATPWTFTRRVSDQRLSVPAVAARPDTAAFGSVNPTIKPVAMAQTATPIEILATSRRDTTTTPVLRSDLRSYGRSAGIVSVITHS